eukprot:5674906-Lingulodinium_polyedra.AAC.1
MRSKALRAKSSWSSRVLSVWGAALAEPADLGLEAHKLQGLEVTEEVAGLGQGLQVGQLGLGEVVFQHWLSAAAGAGMAAVGIVAGLGKNCNEPGEVLQLGKGKHMAGHNQA